MGRRFVELTARQNCNIKVGCYGLQLRIFNELSPRQNCELEVGCSGLQWQGFRGFTPGQNSDVEVDCNGRTFVQLNHLAKTAMLVWAALGLQWEDV